MSERAKPIVVRSTPRRSSIAEVGAVLKTRISHWTAENPEAVARLLAWFKEEVAERSGEPGLLTLGRSLLLSVAPPNWQSLPIGTHERVDHLICETGICLVWVPEANVIVRLLDAPTRNSRVEVLLDESTRILDSIAARLDEVTHPEAVELRALAIEAVEVHRSGYFAASQALAASIITAVIEKHYGFKFKGARDAFEAEAPAAAGMWSHRRALVQRALQFAIDTSWMRDGRERLQPAPDRPRKRSLSLQRGACHRSVDADGWFAA
jgi:hypothetical protein